MTFCYLNHLLILKIQTNGGFKMRKLLSVLLAIVLCLFFVNVSLADVESECAPWMKIITEDHRAKIEDVRYFSQWTDGARSDYNLDLKKITFRVECTGMAERQEYVLVTYLLDLNALCLDQNGLKKRVRSQREVMALIDKKTKKVLGTQLMSAKPKEILDGWDGKDV
jgi:hypothetical protein